MLWGHADHLSLACSDRRLIPALRRLLLTPLLSALYTAKSDIVTLALEQILRLASRHLLVPGSRANDESEEALQVHPPRPYHTRSKALAPQLTCVCMCACMCGCRRW